MARAGHQLMLKYGLQASYRFGGQVTHRLRSRAESDKAFYARCKRALIVAEWIGGMSVSEIENNYSTNRFFYRIAHGDIRGFADGSRFCSDNRRHDGGEFTRRNSLTFSTTPR